MAREWSKLVGFGHILTSQIHHPGGNTRQTTAEVGTTWQTKARLATGKTSALSLFVGRTDKPPGMARERGQVPMGYDHARRTDELRDTWAPIKARIDTLDRAMWQRATDTAYAAGVGHTGRNVWSNAMLGRDYGQPWSGVDYSLLRRAMWLDERRTELRRLETRLWRAMHDRFFPGVCA